MSQPTITIDLYDGDTLVRRTDVECPKDFENASQMYDWLRNAILALQNKVQY